MEWAGPGRKTKVSIVSTSFYMGNVTTKRSGMDVADEVTRAGTADSILSDFLGELDRSEVGGESTSRTAEQVTVHGEVQDINEANIRNLSSSGLSANDAIRHGSSRIFRQEDMPTEQMGDDKMKNLKDSIDHTRTVAPEPNRSLISEFIVQKPGGRALARRSRSPFRMVQHEEQLPPPDNGLAPQSNPVAAQFLRSNSKKSVRILSPRDSHESMESQPADDMEFVACPHTLRVSRRSKSPERRITSKSVLVQRFASDVEAEAFSDTPDGNRIVAFDLPTPQKGSARRSSHSPSPQPRLPHRSSQRALDAPDPDGPPDGFRAPAPIFRRRTPAHGIDLSRDDESLLKTTDGVAPDHAVEDDDGVEEHEEDEEEGADLNRPPAGSTVASTSSPLLSRVHRLFPVLRLARSSAAATAGPAAANGAAAADAGTAPAPVQTTPVTGKKRFKRAARRIMIVQASTSASPAPCQPLTTRPPPATPLRVLRHCVPWRLPFWARAPTALERHGRRAENRSKGPVSGRETARSAPGARVLCRGGPPAAAARRCRAANIRGPSRGPQARERYETGRMSRPERWRVPEAGRPRRSCGRPAACASARPRRDVRRGAVFGRDRAPLPPVPPGPESRPVGPPARPPAACAERRGGAVGRTIPRGKGERQGWWPSGDEEGALRVGGGSA